MHCSDFCGSCCTTSRAEIVYFFNKVFLSSCHLVNLSSSLQSSLFSLSSSTTTTGKLFWNFLFLEGSSSQVIFSWSFYTCLYTFASTLFFSSNNTFSYFILLLHTPFACFLFFFFFREELHFPLTSLSCNVQGKFFFYSVFCKHVSSSLSAFELTSMSLLSTINSITTEKAVTFFWKPFCSDFLKLQI